MVLLHGAAETFSPPTTGMSDGTIDGSIGDDIGND